MTVDGFKGGLKRGLLTFLTNKLIFTYGKAV